MLTTLTEEIRAYLYHFLWKPEWQTSDRHTLKLSLAPKCQEREKYLLFSCILFFAFIFQLLCVLYLLRASTLPQHFTSRLASEHYQTSCAHIITWGPSQAEGRGTVGLLWSLEMELPPGWRPSRLLAGTISIHSSFRACWCTTRKPWSEDHRTLNLLKLNSGCLKQSYKCTDLQEGHCISIGSIVKTGLGWITHLT